MNRTHVDALLLVELRRLMPLFRRLLAGSVALALLFVVTGRASLANMFGLAIGASVGYVMAVPLQMTRDKMERTLEFVAGLPVAPSSIAAAKFAAAAIFVVPAALQIGLALVWYGRGVLAVSGTAIAALSIAVWGVMTGASWLLLAATSATEPERLLGAPMVGLAGLVVVFSVLGNRLLPHPAETVRWFLHQQWAPEAAAAVLVLTAGAAAWMAIRIATRGIARYRPRRDQMT
jgi:hypothetical protein